MCGGAQMALSGATLKRGVFWGVRVGWAGSEIAGKLGCENCQCVHYINKSEFDKSEEKNTYTKIYLCPTVHREG